jgi:CBS domain-containing protein
MQKLKEIMTPYVESITPEETVQDAAMRMKDLNVGAIPVCDEGALVGMVTDRDLVVRVLAEGRDHKEVTVSEAMSPDIVYCFEDDDTEKASQIMADRQIRRLPILSREEKLVGIIALADLATRGSEAPSSCEVLEQVSGPTHVHSMIAR